MPVVDEVETSEVSRKRTPGSRVRYKWHGLTHVSERQAGRWRTYVVIGGNRYRILNETLPLSTGRQYQSHPQDAVCDQCGHAYSHVMTEVRSICSECEIENSAERARVLERQGVRLGWGFHELDDEAPEYQYQTAHQKGVIGGRSTS